MDKLISRGEDLLHTLESIDTDILEELIEQVSDLKDRLEEAYEEYQIELNDYKDKASYFEDLYAQSEAEKIKLLNLIKILSDELELSR